MSDIATQTAFEAFALPLVSDDNPCGPDLDLEGDSEFMNYMAAVEGWLPANYYAFKREDVGLPAARAKGEKLLARTLDVRLVVLLAKLAALDRDLAGFARWVGALAWLLTDHWEACHPRAEGGEYLARLGQLMTLDDNATVRLPLQYAPLLERSREGALIFRAQMVATGAATPRIVSGFDEKGQARSSEPEKFMPSNTIERLLREIEIENLSRAVALFRGLAASLTAIATITVERVGHEMAVQSPGLTKLVADILEFLSAVLTKRDPTLAPPPAAPADDETVDAMGAAAAVKAPGAFATLADVDAALGSALGYFQKSEPSSPALLLIRQARNSLGKNLYEVMKLLAPTHADNARVFVGGDSSFTVPVKSLANLPSEDLTRAQPEPAPSRNAALALIDAVGAHMLRAEP